MARGRTKKVQEATESEVEHEPVSEPEVSANEEPTTDTEEAPSTNLSGKELESHLMNEFEAELEKNLENGLVLSKRDQSKRKAHIRLEVGMQSLEEQLKTLNAAHTDMVKTVNDYHRTAKAALEAAISTMKHASKQSEKQLPKFHKKVERQPAPEQATSKHLRAVIDREKVTAGEAYKLICAYIKDVQERLVKKGVEKPTHEMCRQEDKKLHKFIPDDLLKEYIAELHEKKVQLARDRGEPEPAVPENKFLQTHVMHFIHRNLEKVKST